MYSDTGAVDRFHDSNKTVILRILTAVFQRLGGRKRGETPGGLHYPYVCDLSRMYCERAKPRVDTANILRATTFWTQPELVAQAVFQNFQKLRNGSRLLAREPDKRALSIDKEMPSNPRLAMEIFLHLRSRQRERGQPVGEEYARAILTYKDLFMQYSYQQLADSLPTVPQERIHKGTGEMDVTASGSSQPPDIDPNQLCLSQVQATTDTEQVETIQPEDFLVSDNFTLSGAVTPAQDEPERGTSQMELNNLLTIDDGSPPPV